MPPLTLLVVGGEKELPSFEETLEACKKRVGPMKVFSAHKAVDAVGRLQVGTNLIVITKKCHVQEDGNQLFYALFCRKRDRAAPSVLHF